MRIAIGLVLSSLVAGSALAQPINLHPIPPGRNPELPNLLLEFPGDVPPGRTNPTPGPVYSLRLEGEVASLGPREIVVQAPGGQETFVTLRPETVMTWEGAPVTFDEIPQGAEVRVIFDMEGAERVATEIDAAPRGETVPVEPTAPPVSTEIPGAGEGRVVTPPGKGP